MRTQKILIASVLGFAMLGAAPISAYAQAGGQQNTVSVDLDQVDVREALRALFKSTGLSYTIAPEVQGTVTVNLKNVPLETALQNVLKQVDATYRIEAGVYTVIKREPPIETQPLPPEQNTGGNNHVRRKVYIRNADPMFLATLLGSDKGNQNYSLAPEMSTVIKSGSMGGGFGNGFGGSSGNNGRGQGTGMNGQGNGMNGQGRGNNGSGRGMGFGG